MTARTFLVHGLIAGLIGGIAAFLVAFAVGEPQVDAAIAREEAAASQAADETHTHDHEHGSAAPAEESAHSHGEDAEVSRATQSTWGLATGTLGSGIVIGGLVALVAALGMGRLGGLGPVASTVTVTAIGFTAMALVPFLKYPATPPAVGEAATIGERTATYFGFVALSVLFAIAATLAARALLGRLGAVSAVVLAALGYVVSVGLAAWLLPSYASEIGDFPAATLWNFRVSSLLTLTALWGTIGVALAVLTERTWARVQRDVVRRELAASL